MQLVSFDFFDYPPPPLAQRTPCRIAPGGPDGTFHARLRLLGKGGGRKCIVADT